MWKKININFVRGMPELFVFSGLGDHCILHGIYVCAWWPCPQSFSCGAYCRCPASSEGCSYTSGFSIFFLCEQEKTQKIIEIKLIILSTGWNSIVAPLNTMSRIIAAQLLVFSESTCFSYCSYGYLLWSELNFRSLFVPFSGKKLWSKFIQNC